MTRFLRWVSLLFTGLFAGFLVGVLVLENSLRGYGAEVYTQVRQVELDSLDTLASVTLIPAILTTVVLAIRARGNDRGLVLVAAVLLLLVFATTLAINLPINADQANWSVQSPPTDWSTTRDRWQLAHAFRTAAALLAFASLATADARQSSARPPAPDSLTPRPPHRLPNPRPPHRLPNPRPPHRLPNPRPPHSTHLPAI